MAPPTPHPASRDAARPAGTRLQIPQPDPAAADGDALARAARDVAAPRRRLLAALRDAHAVAGERITALRRCDVALREAGGDELLRAVLARLLGEAEEQLRRLEILFAQLREKPGAGLVATDGIDLAAIALRRTRDHRHALLLAFEAEETFGAREAEALRDLAHLAGQHLVARLLDLTAAERRQSARGIAAISHHLAGAEGPTARQ